MKVRILILLFIAGLLLPPPQNLHAQTRSGLFIETAGQLGGASYTVAVSGKRAYFGLGTRLLIADISNPNVPVVLGQSAPINARLTDIAVSGAYVYLIASGQLRVFDVSAPATPTEAARVDVQEKARWLTLANGMLYVSGGDRVDIFRLDNPALPTKTATYSGDGRLLDAGRIAVNDGLAYVPGGFNRGLVVLDVNNPAAPQSVGSYPSTGGYATQGVRISGGYAYIVGGFDLQVAHLTDPRNPQKIADFSLDAVGGAVDVLVANNILYLPIETAGVSILDVSNPANPQSLGLLERGDSPPYTLALAGNHLFVSSIRGGVRVADVSTPASPTYAAEMRSIGWGRKMAQVGDYIYLAEGGRGLWVVERTKINDGLNAARFIDVGNPALDVTVQGRYLFVAGGADGVAILDAQDPANPVAVATHNTPGSAWVVAVAGDYAYVADYNAGVRILDIRDVTKPSEVGSIPPADTLSGTTQVSATADFLFVYSGDKLDIYSISSSPAAPAKVGGYSSGLHLSNVISEGKLLYLTEGFNSHRLLILDISNPAQPVEVGSHPLSSTTFTPSVWEIAKEGDRVAVAYGYDGVFVFDISTPASPSQLGHFATAWEATGLLMLGDALAVGNGDGGLLHLQISPRHDLFLPALNR